MSSTALMHNNAMTQLPPVLPLRPSPPTSAPAQQPPTSTPAPLPPSSPKRHNASRTPPPPSAAAPSRKRPRALRRPAALVIPPRPPTSLPSAFYAPPLPCAPSSSQLQPQPQLQNQSTFSASTLSTCTTSSCSSTQSTPAPASASASAAAAAAATAAAAAKALTQTLTATQKTTTPTTNCTNSNAQVLSLALPLPPASATCSSSSCSSTSSASSASSSCATSLSTTSALSSCSSSSPCASTASCCAPFNASSSSSSSTSSAAAAAAAAAAASAFSAACPSSANNNFSPTVSLASTPSPPPPEPPLPRFPAGVRAAAATRRGRRRRVNEDRMFAHPSELVFGVCDGHGAEATEQVASPDAAITVATHLPGLLASGVGAESAFETLDARVCAALPPRSFVGTTVTAATLIPRSNCTNTYRNNSSNRNSSRFSHLRLAHVGDSRAVLISADGARASVLTKDHDPSREDEAARIARAGGYVIRGRVNGVLAVSRAIGARALKTFVPPTPDVQTLALDEHNSGVLILASDGLWDMMSADECATLLRQFAAADRHAGKHEQEGGAPGAPENLQLAAEALVEEAAARGSRDDISVMLVDLRQSV